MLNLFFTPWLKRLAIVVALTTIVGLPASANPDRGRLEGSVTDPSGAIVAGARIALRDRTGLKVYEARTDGEGKFSISNIAEGRYALTVEAEGFSQSKKIDLEVRDAEVETVAVELSVAAITDHVIVTATRTETPSSILAGSVSVFASEEFDRRGLSLISEPLRLMPGFAVAQTGGRGGLTSVFVRGGESDYNKVLIDGVPVNAAGGAFDFAALTPENFERVEAVRGPRSALFGSDAMTSVIQLVTRRGSSSTPELELSGEGGSFDFHRETARLSGLHNWFDYSTSFGFLSTDGRFDNSDYINRSASANLGFRSCPERGPAYDIAVEQQHARRSRPHSFFVRRPGPAAKAPRPVCRGRVRSQDYFALESERPLRLFGVRHEQLRSRRSRFDAARPAAAPAFQFLPRFCFYIHRAPEAAGCSLPVDRGSCWYECADGGPGLRARIGSLHG